MTRNVPTGLRGSTSWDEATVGLTTGLGIQQISLELYSIFLVHVILATTDNKVIESTAIQVVKHRKGSQTSSLEAVFTAPEFNGVDYESSGQAHKLVVN